jgi:hypothetical protein
MQELPTGPSELRVDVDALERLTDASSYADAVHRLLTVARTQLRMSTAWVSEFVGDDQILRFVDAEPGADAPEEGSSMPLTAPTAPACSTGASRRSSPTPAARLLPRCSTWART